MYRKRLSAEAKEFEKLKNKFQEEKASFDEEKKSEEWGREGLRRKLQASEELLAKEQKEWCITNLEAEVASLKDKYEEAKSDRERAEILSKDRDLAGKDAEIAELKHKLFEAQEKNDSLEIDLAAEKVKVDTAKEARKISTSALNVAQTNYVEAQTIVDSLLSDSEWMREHGVATLDIAVVALTDVARAVGHRGGYLECTQHVEEALKQHFGTRHCSVTDQVDEMLAKVEEVYDNLCFPVMELVINALKHDDYVARLKSIFVVPETVELSDEEETVGGGGEE
ncbi:hypothetical protein Hanom_Chr07g00621281 [Helianthus anomalus]